MKILGIETSCDETAISIIEAEGEIDKPEFKVLADSLFSQVKIHAEYGGVFPALAKREHSKNLPFLIEETIKKSGVSTKKNPVSEEIKAQAKELLNREGDLAEKVIEFAEKQKPDIDLIAFTAGPGLEPALWVGINTAKALSVLWDIPLEPTNHMEGHIASVLIGENINLQYPAIALLISGGHTELIFAEKPLQYKRIGQTRDDALGEAYDKVARLMDLKYPGGPEISKLAEEARKGGLEKSRWDFPRPMINSDDFDFSFSGLKTAVLYAIRDHGDLNDNDKKSIALEFEETVTEVLVKKVGKVLENFEVKSFIAGGGVIANKHIRAKLKEACSLWSDVKVYFPEISLAGDNAIMIAAAGYLRFKKNGPHKDALSTKASGTLSYL